MKVLLASDGSSQSKNAARFLSQLKIDGKLQLAILTVSMAPELTVHGNIQNPGWEEQEQAFVAMHHAQLQELFSGRCDDHLSKRHETGNASQVILEVSKQIDADLIVMGAVGHSMVSRMLLGSVSDNVATQAKRSVLVVRPQEDNLSPHVSANKIAVAFDGSVASCESVSQMMAVKWDHDTEVKVVTVAPKYNHLMGDGMPTTVLTNEEEMFERMRAKGASQVSSGLSDHYHYGMGIESWLRSMGPGAQESDRDF